MSTPTPDAVNGTPTTVASEEIRARFGRLYAQVRPTMEAYHQYAESAKALSIEFLKALTEERFQCAKQEGICVLTLDSASSPKTNERLVTELEAQLAATGRTVKWVNHDLQTGKFYLFA